MTTDASEPSLEEFYGPVLVEFPEDVQDLVLALFEGKYATTTELSDAIGVKAAKRAEQEDDS